MLNERGQNFDPTNFNPKTKRPFSYRDARQVNSKVVSNNTDNSNPPMNVHVYNKEGKVVNFTGIKRGIHKCPDCQDSRRVYDVDGNIIECSKCCPEITALVDNKIEEVTQATNVITS